ncbi:MAG: UDP-N-acetylmuramate dehydrogenase [Phycisphaeraceae bacterium]
MADETGKTSAAGTAAALLEDLHVSHEPDAPLGERTWYRVGGRAEVLARPSSVAQLSAVASRCHQQGVPMRVLGRGANLLVREAGVPGVVVDLSDPAFAQLKIEDETITAGAGYDLFKLVLAAARAGLGGLEVLAGIPGSVGGAVRMNAGGAYGDIGQSVRRVQVMSGSGQVYYRDRDDLDFGYRRTNIMAPVILEVEFELTREDPDELARRVKEIFFYKKSSQPMGARSAGCAFKNPPGTSAGRLIDEAGLKGYRIGGARVSEVHANFVVAEEGAKAEDIARLIEHVKEVVREQTGVELEREVVVWP